MWINIKDYLSLNFLKMSLKANNLILYYWDYKVNR